MTKTGTNPIFLTLVVVGLSIVGTLTSVTPVEALDLTGSARVWAGPVKTDFLQQDQVDQRYRLRLSQQLSPWLTVFAGYAYTDFRTDFDLGPTFERSSREPLFGFFYDRPTFSARFTGFDRAIRTTNSSQDLDVRSLQAELDWRPRWGPRFSLRIQDSNNVIDPQIFGRETDAQFIDFAILYDRQLWSARYRYQLSKTDNKTTGFKLDQGTHELRGTFGKRWWQDRFYVSLDSRCSTGAGSADPTRHLHRPTDTGAPRALRRRHLARSRRSGTRAGSDRRRLRHSHVATDRHRRR